MADLRISAEMKSLNFSPGNEIIKAYYQQLNLNGILTNTVFNSLMNKRGRYEFDSYISLCTIIKTFYLPKYSKAVLQLILILFIHGSCIFTFTSRFANDWYLFP